MSIWRSDINDIHACGIDCSDAVLRQNAPWLCSEGCTQVVRIEVQDKQMNADWLIIFRGRKKNLVSFISFVLLDHYHNLTIF